MGAGPSHITTISVAMYLIFTPCCAQEAAPCKVERFQYSIYVASPLGFSEAGREFYYRTLLPLLDSHGFKIIDPWRLTDPKVVERVQRLPFGPDRRAAWRNLNREIGANNKRGLNRADIVLAVVDGTDVDSGTAAEVGYAYGLGKPVLGYRGDFRLAGDNEGAIVNLQVQYFIENSGGEIVESIGVLPEKLCNTLRAANNTGGDGGLNLGRDTGRPINER